MNRLLWGLLFHSLVLQPSAALSADSNGHKVYKKIRMVGSANPIYPNNFVCVLNQPGSTYKPEELCNVEVKASTYQTITPGIANPTTTAATVLPIQKPELYGPPVKPADYPAGSSFGKTFTGEKNFEALKALALSKKVPAVIYDRAVANYNNAINAANATGRKKNRNKTTRGCFMGADTTSSQGKTWVFCFNPQPTVIEIPTHFATGIGEGCSNTLVNSGECPQFWSNRPDSCLSEGGNFITGRSRSAFSNGQGRVFTPLIGLDSGANSNSNLRNIGIHSYSNHSNVSLEGKIDPRTVSKGCVVWPHNFSEVPASDLSSAAEGGAMAFYSYPAKEDLQKFMNGQEPEYWDPTCRTKIDYAAWLDETDTAATISKIQQLGTLKSFKGYLNEERDSTQTAEPPSP